MARTAKKGFTLIELLIVVVIIGILAAIAIPKFANTKEKAYYAAMKSDLRNLVTAQEAYFSERGNVYANDITQLGTNYKASTGVTVVLSGAGTGTSWGATAAHSALGSRTCGIAVGQGATSEGEPICP